MKKAAREKPSLKTILDAMKPGASMDVEQLKKAVPLSESAIWNACKRAIDEGYLTHGSVKRKGCQGRKRNVYRRTDKPYISPIPSAKALRHREYRARDKEWASQSERVVPFRHWQDSLMFGAYPMPFEPKIGVGRIYRQSMSVNDDEEELGLEAA
jgi:hypothetical protein